MTKILIVDDSANTRTTLGDIFKEKKYKVVEAASGEEALKKIKKDKIDLVLLDTKMPNMGGYEVCKRIKKINKNIKVIIFTEFVSPFRMSI